MEQLAKLMIARRVRGGYRTDESAALLADLLARYAGDNLAAALVYQGFATAAGAARFARVAA